MIGPLVCDGLYGLACLVATLQVPGAGYGGVSRLGRSWITVIGWKRASGAGLEKRGSAAGGAAPSGKRPSAGGGGGLVAGGPPPHPLTCLGGIQRLAWQSLELAGPVTDIVRMQQANWFQLSGETPTGEV